MNLGIESKVALVTGGARGIGKAIVQALSAECRTVYYTSRDESAAEALQGENRIYWGPNLPPGHQPFDILVNNIGHQCEVTDPHAPIEDWRRVVSVNVDYAVEMSRRALQIMKKRGWGRIVNIGSLGGHEQQGPWQYCAAKAALSAYTRCMGRTLASEAPGVVMSTVLPGVVVTEGGHWDEVQRTDPARAKRYLAERCPLGRFGTVDEIAPAVAFLCSRHASFCHGAIWTVDGGQARGFNW